MLYYTGLLLLIIAVSMDGFGVGMTYGMRQTKVPILAISIIMCCSGIIVFLSMFIGDFLKQIMSPVFADILGGMILIGLGFFSLVNTIQSKKKAVSEKTETVKNSSQMNGKFVHVKTVFTTPEKADLDQSGVISSGEAFLLGLALALDAFGAGIGAAMIGYPPFLTAFSVAIMSGLFLQFGIHIGFFLTRNRYLKNLSFLPAIFLILIGLSNILL
ncbi:sporulation membrane protein YtaF [Cerasibacillus terrae]|uniref:Sporulation membrane protein YtaF n=1 Tax=Cerasibacillus terrae TaxID=2498845 RepID=A0A5C8NV94_9BACI|nr:sporulation membrane protein YtaF [Cerasibacillus terrae]